MGFSNQKSYGLYRQKTVPIIYYRTVKVQIIYIYYYYYFFNVNV
jgi:hypothetical protein